MQEGGYVHAMYLDDNSPVAGGREIWGFPKKLASPKISHESENSRLHAALRLGALRVGDNGLQAPRAELCGKVGDGVSQAADFISAASSIPSLNFTPSMTFGNWF